MLLLIFFLPEDMNFYNITPQLLAVSGSTGSPVLLATLGRQAAPAVLIGDETW